MDKAVHNRNGENPQLANGKRWQGRTFPEAPNITLPG